MLNSLTPKQKEFWKNANHRWNIKTGATRSGKTFLDYYLIPKRIRAVSGLDGLNVVLGNTKGTLQRNIIEPLQDIWGVELVSDIKSDNTAFMFGEKVHCIGADKINQVNKLRGSSIKYCYGDEVATWHEDVFNMLKSRLDKAYSKFDGTCNPESPNHWLKKFIDSDADVFSQKYTLYDNTHLNATVVKALETEYTGIYYDRFILGEWVRAEGIIFRDFAENPEKYEIEEKAIAGKRFKNIGVGYDIGGNKSNYALVCTAIDYADNVYVLACNEIYPQDLRSEDVERQAKDFITQIEDTYNQKVKYGYVDDNYYTIINGLNDWRYMFGSAAAIKSTMPLDDRPLLLSKIMAQERFKIVKGKCNALKEQLQNAVYDDKQDRAVILDDGSMNIDCIDAFFYSIAEDYLFLAR